MQNLAATVSSLWFPSESLHTLLNTSYSWIITPFFFLIWKNKSYQKEGSCKRIWDVKPPLPLPCEPICCKAVATLHPAGLQSSSLQNTGWDWAQNIQKGKDTAVLASCLPCKFSHTDVMTLHVCSLTHKPKNTLHAGRHWENQTLDSNFHWKIL